MALVGTQLRWSRRREAYPKFVETFGMPIYVNGLGRGSLPPDNPYFFSQTRKDALKQADVVLIFGTPLDFRLGYGRESHFNPARKLIQVDLDGAEIGRNRPIEVGIIGDTGIVMEQLTAAAPRRRLLGRDGEALARRDARARAAEVGAHAARSWTPMRCRSTRCAPARRSPTSLEPDAIVIGDGGDFVATAASVAAHLPAGALAGPGSARHPRRRARLRHGRQAGQAGAARW